RSQCTFCSQLKTDLYLCPRCEQNYCSSRCYRSEKHHECWEDFCRRHVEEDLKAEVGSEENGHS
uniref:HIT-type domain-containing protein n=1 Tax=Parascaris univalens TaxID=6257 RepID=A0A915BIB5_PARUN